MRTEARNGRDSVHAMQTLNYISKLMPQSLALSLSLLNNLLHRESQQNREFTFRELKNRFRLTRAREKYSMKYILKSTLFRNIFNLFLDLWISILI